MKSYAVSAGIGGVGVGASVSVWTLGDAFDAGYDTAATSGNNSLAIQDKSSTSDPSYSSFADYADGQTNRSDVTTAIAGYSNPDDDSNQATFLGIRDQVSGTVTDTSSAQATTASDAINASDTANTEGVTEAVIAGTVTSGGNVNVFAKEDDTLKYVAGAVEVAASGSIGAGIGIATINGAALAHIDGIVTAGGGVTIEADQEENLDGTAFIGEASTLPAAGAGVAIINDHSVQDASIRDGAQILSASAITVTANHGDSKFETLAVEAQISGVGTIGASIARSVADGETSAYIGNATIGDFSATTPTVGDVTIEADSNISPKARAYTGSGGVAFAGDGNKEVAQVTPTVTAYFASQGGPAADGTVSGDSINRVSGDVTIAVNSTAEPRAIGVGIAVASGLAIPVTLTSATASPTVEAFVGENTILHVVGNAKTDPDSATGRLEISAIAADDPQADGTAAGGAGSPAAARACLPRTRQPSTLTSPTARRSPPTPMWKSTRARTMWGIPAARGPTTGDSA